MIENGMDPNFGFYYWQPDLRALRQSFDKSQMRALIGLRGELANWDYQANIFQSRSQVKQIHERENYNNLGIFNTGLSSPLMDERLLRPLDANNSLTGQLLNQRFWEPQVTGQTTLTTSEVRASRPWFEIEGKDVMIGWGLEIRREQVASMVNPDLSAATFPPPSFQGTRRNAAAYAEAQIPVKPDWDVIAAIRSDHYNDVGPSHNGKLAARWKINSRWALRSSIGTGFRAPSIGQVQVVAEPFRNGQTNLKACT
jgi:iron complex outermembrane recepter protein